MGNAAVGVVAGAAHRQQPRAIVLIGMDGGVAGRSQGWGEPLRILQQLLPAFAGIRIDTSFPAVPVPSGLSVDSPANIPGFTESFALEKRHVDETYIVRGAVGGLLTRLVGRLKVRTPTQALHHLERRSDLPRRTRRATMQGLAHRANSRPQITISRISSRSGTSLRRRLSRRWRCWSVRSTRAAWQLVGLWPRRTGRETARLRACRASRRTRGVGREARFIGGGHDGRAEGSCVDLCREAPVCLMSD